MTKKRARFASRLLLVLSVAMAATACQNQPAEQADTSDTQSSDRYFIIGQDLAAVRDYYQSSCCVQPDGNTAYVVLYSILDESLTFKGLGINAEGEPIEAEVDFGTGPSNLLKSATEFGGGLAIGLELVENEHPGAMQALITGEYDQHLEQLAGFFKMIEGPIWLRVAYEFDGVWNQGYADTAQYISAYRYVVNHLRLAGVSNVEYVWQSSTSAIDDMIEKKHENISNWYPGDDYVDWVGLSWFLNLDEKPLGEITYTPPTQYQLSNEVLAFARAHHKPVMIAESSPQGFDLANNFNANIAAIWDGPANQDKISMSNAEIWDAWYAPLFKYMKQNKDVIRGFAYINDNWDAKPRWGAPHNEGYWGDSRLQVNPEIAGRFNQAVTEWRNQ